MTRRPTQRRAHPAPLGPWTHAPKMNFFSRPGPGCTDLPAVRTTVWLDQTDRIISLPAHWESLAQVMGEPDLDRDTVLGRPVSWFIEDETIRECFRMMFERARREGRAARIVSRCDSADEARAMQLRCVPMSAGAIECTWTFLRGDAALEFPHAKRRLFRESELVRMCSWCRQVDLNAGWQRLDVSAAALGLLDHLPLPRITHGICPRCSAAVTAETMDVPQGCVAV